VSKRAKSNATQKIAVGILILLFAIVVGGAIISDARLKGQPTKAVAPDFRRSLGSAQARVTIIEYGDFGCPTCKSWQRLKIIDQIFQKYGDQVRFIWRDFPVITAESPKAAEAAYCAYDQGQFWAYHDLLFEKAPALGIAALKGYARELGLDGAQFDECLDTGKRRADVEANFDDALNRHLLGTPSFFVNDRPIVGPASFNQLSALIDSELNKPD
jgi:protein-disulfide isomerase